MSMEFYRKECWSGCQFFLLFYAHQSTIIKSSFYPGGKRNTGRKLGNNVFSLHSYLSLKSNCHIPPFYFKCSNLLDLNPCLPFLFKWGLSLICQITWTPHFLLLICWIFVKKFHNTRNLSCYPQPPRLDCLSFHSFQEHSSLLLISNTKYPSIHPSIQLLKWLPDFNSVQTLSSDIYLYLFHYANEIIGGQVLL